MKHVVPFVVAASVVLLVLVLVYHAEKHQHYKNQEYSNACRGKGGEPFIDGSQRQCLTQRGLL